MSKIASTLANVALGLTFVSTALAQTAPDANTNPNTGTDNDAATDDSAPTSQPAETPSPEVDATITDELTTTTPNPSPTIVDPPRATLPQRSTEYVTLPPPPPATDDIDGEWTPFGTVGIALSAGGGAGGFVNDALRNTTDVGGDWDVRATVGTRSPLAIEGSYIGSAQGIEALGLSSGAVLLGNGVQGALRLNATIDLPVQPFVFAGAAWRRYDLTNTTANLSDVSGSDDVLEIPMGLGLAARWSGLILDARGEFRATTNEDLLPELTEDEVEVDSDNFAAMHRWGIKATVGVEF